MKRLRSRFCIDGYKLLLSRSIEYIILRELALTRSLSDELDVSSAAVPDEGAAVPRTRLMRLSI